MTNSPTVPMNPAGPAPVAVEEAISAELLRVIVEEIGSYEKTHSYMQGMCAAAHARVMTVLHERSLQSQPPSAPSGSSAMDSARLDWMQEHIASVSVNEEDVLHCTVQSSNDFQATGFSDPYDIRKAIDAARLSAPTPSNNDGRAAE